MTRDDRIRERENEQEAILGLVRRVRGGRGGGLLIGGEAGTGKPLLMAEAARVAGQEQVAVDTAPGDEVTAAWRDRLERQTAHDPLLVSLDDLQWAGRLPLHTLSALPD